MAAIHDLLAQIADEALRERIEQEVNKLSKTKKFGLVFEQHLPECTPLYDMPIKVGVNVMLKNSKDDKGVYVVLKISDEEVICGKKENIQDQVSFAKGDIVRVAEFGEPIYPYLKPIDSVCNAPDSYLWHTLIEADNYHALQLLEYLYAGKVDCIYIDPPYNTGARDWKYNNDYVDSSDSYRHSKWLSFIERRLRIAKKLLNPNESVLIITIDDKEYLHLGCLLEELFPDANIQMVSDVINPKGTMQRKIFPRTDEYIFFVWIGSAEPCEQKLNKDWLIGNADNTKHNRYRWQPFVRANISRQKTPSMFYPIFVNKEGNKVLRVGTALDKSVDRNEIEVRDGEVAIFPINTKGEEAIWHLSQESFLEAYNKGFIRLGELTDKGMSISYLSSGMQKKIEEGVLPILGRNPDGSVIFGIDEYEPEFIPGTQWRIKSHDATEHGTKLLQNFIGKRFSYPKALYSTEDSIRFFVSNKPKALVLDFFAGSGTTLHAINLLNAEDGGKRRCIIVTNNEVSEDEAKQLEAKGIQRGSDEWNAMGIARYVTWPRTVSSIYGKNVDGDIVEGEYITQNDTPIKMEDGFKANAIFFKLGFLDKTAVALGMQFREMLPVLWMKAGAIGKCPAINSSDLPNMLILPDNQFAVLIDENAFSEFEEKIRFYPEIQTVFLITDYEVNYQSMAKNLGVEKIYQLYRDYLDNFRINHGRN